MYFFFSLIAHPNYTVSELSGWFDRFFVRLELQWLSIYWLQRYKNMSCSSFTFVMEASWEDQTRRSKTRSLPAFQLSAKLFRSPKFAVARIILIAVAVLLNTFDQHEVFIFEYHLLNSIHQRLICWIVINKSSWNESAGCIRECVNVFFGICPIFAASLFADRKRSPLFTGQHSLGWLLVLFVNHVFHTIINLYRCVSYRSVYVRGRDTTTQNLERMVFFCSRNVLQTRL